MHTVHLSKSQLLGPAGNELLPGRLAACGAMQHRTPPLARERPDELTQHQAVYEELLASPDWAGRLVPPGPAPRQHALSACALTRDLAGWSPPQLGRRPTANY